jgi:lipopolysaccharide export system permease protein
VARLKPLYLADRYIATMLLQTVLFSIVLFTVMWLCPETLFKLIQYVFAEKIDLLQAGEMLLLHIPPVLQQSIPIAVMVGCIFLFRRISLNSELIAMMACGMSPVRIMWPVFLVGLLFAGSHFFIQEVISPKTAPRLEATYYKYDLKPKKDDNFVYVEKNRQGQLDKFILIGQTQQEALRDFVILYYSVMPDGGVQIARILRAPTGRWDAGAKQWQIFNGVDYGLDEDGVFRETHHFPVQWVSTSKYPAKLLTFSKINPINMRISTLKEYINLLEEGGQFQDVRFSEVRLYQKFAFPLATLLFAIIGGMLGIEKVRTNGNLGLIYGAVILFIYSILVPFATNVGSLGVLPPVISAWIPLAAAGAATLLILNFRRYE